MPTVKHRHLLIAAVLLVTGIIISPQAAVAAEHEVIIGFHEHPGPSQRELISTLGGQISHEYSLIPAVVATIPAAGLIALRDHPLVAYIEENSEVTSIDPPYQPMLYGASVLSAAATGDEYEHSWGVQHIGSRTAHSQGIMGKEIKIAVIDSGTKSDIQIGTAQADVAVDNQLVIIRAGRGSVDIQIQACAGRKCCIGDCQRADIT